MVLDSDENGLDAPLILGPQYMSQLHQTPLDIPILL